MTGDCRKSFTSMPDLLGSVRRPLIVAQIVGDSSQTRRDAGAIRQKDKWC